MNEATKQSGRILKHSTIYAIGNIIRQLVGFLMLPIYTRYLTPADYGVVGLLTFAMAVMEPFFGARLGEAMPKFYFQENDEGRKNAVISTALAITGIVSATTAFLLFLIKDSTSVLLFGSSDHGMAVGLFGILILTQAVEYYGMTYIRILQRPKLFISVSLAKLVLQLALNLSLVVWLKLGIMGVVISGVASSSICALALTAYMLTKAGIRFDGVAAKALLKFSWPLWFVGLASLYIYSANRYYIRIFGSLSDVGLYELASKFSSILSFIVWQPFNQFWETERFNYHRQNNHSIFSNTFQFVAALLAALGICIGITAEPVIRIMAGSEFHSSYLAVPALLAANLLSCLTIYINFSFLITEKTRLVSYISYATAAVITVLNVLLIPSFGFIGAAFALALSLLFQFAVTYHQGRKLYDMHILLGAPVLMGFVLIFAFMLSVFVFQSANLWLDIALKFVLLTASLAAIVAILWRSDGTRSQLLTLVASIRSKFDSRKAVRT